MTEHYQQFGLRCAPAPNRYRKMLAASLANDPAPSVSRYATVREAIVERMRVEFPDVLEPLGLDIDPCSGRHDPDLVGVTRSTMRNGRHRPMPVAISEDRSASEAAIVYPEGFDQFKRNLSLSEVETLGRCTGSASAQPYEYHHQAGR